MKKYIFVLMAALALTTSCDDWLDVRGENIQKEKDQFENYKGFRDALTGCYMEMASTDAYGKRLTMTDIEDMANLWTVSSTESSTPARYNLYHHNYSNDNVLPVTKAIYAKLFNTIVSANVLMRNIEEKGGNIGNEQKTARRTPSGRIASLTCCVSLASCHRERPSKCLCLIHTRRVSQRCQAIMRLQIMWPT